MRQNLSNSIKPCATLVFAIALTSTIHRRGFNASILISRSNRFLFRFHFFFPPLHCRTAKMYIQMEKLCKHKSIRRAHLSFSWFPKQRRFFFFVLFYQHRHGSLCTIGIIVNIIVDIDGDGIELCQKWKRHSVVAHFSSFSSSMYTYYCLLYLQLRMNKCKNWNFAIFNFRK